MDSSIFERLYGVFLKPQTYLNMLYLFLAFPLGLAYFIFLVTGLSLGIGLIILWVGLFILAGVLALCWPLTLFERQMAISLLKVEIPLASRAQQPSASVFQQIRNHLSNPVTWKGIAYLFLKFPIGVASFTITTTLGALSLGLVLAPLAYPWAHINIGLWQINSMPAAALACVLGLIIAPLSLHVFNLMADWSGKLAVVMLGNPAPVKNTPEAFPPVVTASS